MPAKGAAARGEQLAAVQAALHERLTSPAVAEALGRAEREAAAIQIAPRRSARSASITSAPRACRNGSSARSRSRRRRVSTRGRRRAPSARSRSSRRASSGSSSSAREQAHAIGVPAGGERYDALLEGYEPGMRVARLAPILERLVGWLAPARRRHRRGAAAPGRLPPRPLRRRRRSGEFTLELLAALGFDLEAGRQDRSIHPFTLGLDPATCASRRASTRRSRCRRSSRRSTRRGHGLYEQDLPAEHRHSLLCAAPSMGLHESQSRLWENLVGRSLPVLARVPAAARRAASRSSSRRRPGRFHRAVNRVERSLVRVEADEVTYNLHIVAALRAGAGAAARRARRARSARGLERARAEALARRPPAATTREGVLQDIHWAWGDVRLLPDLHARQPLRRDALRRARRARCRGSRTRSPRATSPPCAPGSPRRSTAWAAARTPRRSCATPPAWGSPTATSSGT